jgi:ATP synthase protein I
VRELLPLRRLDFSQRTERDLRDGERENFEISAGSDIALQHNGHCKTGFIDRSFDLILAFPYTFRRFLVCFTGFAVRTYPPERVWKMVITQLVLTLFLCLVLLFFGKEAAVSGVAGGIAATAGTLLFALKLFGRYRADEPGQMLGGILGAEFAKLVVMMLIFAAAIRWYEPLNIVAMLAVWLVVHLAPGIMIAVTGNNKESKR